LVKSHFKATGADKSACPLYSAGSHHASVDATEARNTQFVNGTRLLLALQPSTYTEPIP
jgi:hypothetical protein